MQNQNKNNSIIFFGTPKFSVQILSSLRSHFITPTAIISASDKPIGRKKELTPSAVKVYALDNNIPILTPQKLRDGTFLNTLRDFEANVFIIASFGRLLPKTLLDIPSKGVINVHPSLLPKYRGPSPIQTTIINGDRFTGVTLMLTDPEMDHGPIIAQSKEHPVQDKGYIELHDELAHLGGTLLAETLPEWIAGKITPTEQDHKKATFTKLFTKEDGHIDWNKPAIYIYRHVRALEEWPGTYTFYEVEPRKRKRVKILKGHISNIPSHEKPGTVIKEKNGSLAVCTSDVLFIIDILQIEGGRPMSSHDFLNGQSRFLQTLFL